MISYLCLQRFLIYFHVIMTKFVLGFWTNYFFLYFTLLTSRVCCTYFFHIHSNFLKFFKFQLHFFPLIHIHFLIFLYIPRIVKLFHIFFGFFCLPYFLRLLHKSFASFFYPLA